MISDEQGATAEYPATIVPDSTCAHIFKERDMRKNKLTQVAGYSAVKVRTASHLPAAPTEQYSFFQRNLETRTALI